MFETIFYDAKIYKKFDISKLFLTYFSIIALFLAYYNIFMYICHKFIIYGEEYTITER